MTRAEAVEIVAAIDYWGARAIGPARATAAHIVDRLVTEGVLLLDKGDETPERTQGGFQVPDSIIIPLNWSKPPLTGNRTRGNPYARANEVKAAKDDCLDAILDAYVWPVVGADVTLHMRPSSRQRRDADGLFPTLKVCQDALVILGVLPDDSWIHVPSATCRIHPPNGEPAAMWLELDVLTEYEDTP